MVVANRTRIISIVLGLGALVALLASLATLDTFDAATLMYALLNGGTTSLPIRVLVNVFGRLCQCLKVYSND